MRALLRFAWGLAPTAVLFAANPDIPPPMLVGDPATFGVNLQRTMTMLAASTAERRHTVKILFYGQSITEQDWWKTVAADLRHNYPNANLLIENRAIGGFSSQLLVKTAETDLYSFYPDLMIFHVYGSHIEYENIIRRTRERTTAEILMQTDHVNQDTQLTEETDPAKLTPKQWTPWMNYVFLPDTARKYRCGLVDQHNLWKQYLKENNFPAQKLLRDGVHLNAQGNYLMAEYVKPHLVKRPETKLDPMNNDLVKSLKIGGDLKWDGGHLVVDFEGNRVDVIAAEASFETARVLIDGRKPSEFPELYGLTRTTPYPGSIWPCILKVGREKPLQLEEWTLTIKEASEDLKNFKFEVAGSKTGADGAGEAGRKFVSNSGRVVIEPEDWNFDYALKVFKRPLPANFQIKWKAAPNFIDELKLPAIKDRTIESTVTLAQGLPNGRHRLEIIADKPLPMAAIRVYRPALAAQ